MHTFLGLPNNIHPLIYIGILLLLSYAGGHMAHYLKAPRVIGYLVIGILLGSSLLGVLPAQLVREDFGLITHMALAIIAFSIGGSLELPKLKRLGRQILWITLIQALGAFFLTTSVLSLFFFFYECSGVASACFWASYFPMAFVIGAIAAATAPAATLAIVHEYGARGPLTTVLLGVVALDDGLTIFLFAFAVGMAHTFVTSDVLTLQRLLLTPCLSLFLSLAIGGVLGGLVRCFCRLVPTRTAMLGVMSGAIFLTAGLAFSLDAHPLLANMTAGFVVASFVEHHEDLFAVVENIEEPLFGMFFVLAGAHLDLRLLETAGLLALLITLGRFAGKFLGSRVGAGISHAPTEVKNYLGLALLPAAGVTVGLVLEAQDVFGAGPFSELMVNGVLGSVIINELMTPFLVRFSLIKAGEAGRNRGPGD